MTQETLEFQAKMYLFDLNNCATENGFKGEDMWQLSLATNEERIAIEKKYFPTISTKVLPEILAELFTLVKDKMINAKAEMEKRFDADSLFNKTNQHQYLVAYNPKRERRH